MHEPTYLDHALEQLKSVYAETLRIQAATCRMSNDLTALNPTRHLLETYCPVAFTDYAQHFNGSITSRTVFNPLNRSFLQDPDNFQDTIETIDDLMKTITTRPILRGGEPTGMTGYPATAAPLRDAIRQSLTRMNPEEQALARTSLGELEKVESNAQALVSALQQAKQAICAPSADIDADHAHHTGRTKSYMR